MKIILEHLNKKYSCDLSKGIDLSSTLAKVGGEIKAWYVNDSEAKPVKNDDWIGSVEQGSSVNFFNIFFNPHGNGTHTEGFGHISKAQESVNDQVKEYHFIAHYISVEPIEVKTDHIISWDLIKDKVENWDFDALIIKAGHFKSGHDFSNTNPPYFDADCILKIREKGIKHILTDLPSVDREEDAGQLLSHKAWWNFPENPRSEATISELLEIEEGIEEGLYFMNLQLAPFHNDATPSRPVLYKLNEIF
tara:strand:- start:447 stop:1193 length:747 start_codon:yes stop_codon:yes gene_type:complete